MDSPFKILGLNYMNNFSLRLNLLSQKIKASYDFPIFNKLISMAKLFMLEETLESKQNIMVTLKPWLMPWKEMIEL